MAFSVKTLVNPLIPWQDCLGHYPRSRKDNIGRENWLWIPKIHKVCLCRCRLLFFYRNLFKQKHKVHQRVFFLNVFDVVFLMLCFPKLFGRKDLFCAWRVCIEVRQFFSAKLWRLYEPLTAWNLFAYRRSALKMWTVCMIIRKTGDPLMGACLCLNPRLLFLSFYSWNARGVWGFQFTLKMHCQKTEVDPGLWFNA